MASYPSQRDVHRAAPSEEEQQHHLSSAPSISSGRPAGPACIVRTPSLAQSGSITSAGGPGVQSGRTGYFPQVSQSMLDQGRRTIVGPRPPQAMALPGLSAALPPVPLKPSREITASARFPRIAISIPRAPSSFRGLAA
ncbi:hypothetical protein ACCO45_004318 [Purpureocillium lilacinum]|uniref:Uncharacterized protein n=1 Tax=Purpureocillium lilacinum TaxID=33203 RepID=A0ACC4E559_PURLI